jgi:hypothetical protein
MEMKKAGLVPAFFLCRVAGRSLDIGVPPPNLPLIGGGTDPV